MLKGAFHHGLGIGTMGRCTGLSHIVLLHISWIIEKKNLAFACREVLMEQNPSTQPARKK